MLALTGALTERTPPRLVRPETPAEAAAELVGYLRAHGFAP
jgi:electron transfer flavoprotein beta subunit